MASLAHVSVGLAAGKWRASWGGTSFWLAALTYAALAMLPDADVIAFVFRIPYLAPFGHRGATHSLVFAAVVALLARFVFRRPTRVAALIFGVIATHPVLDMFTDGGGGCALLWPFTSERYFWPWRPIPVAPIGLGMFSQRGAMVLAIEFVATLPLIIWALVSPKQADAR